MTWLASGLAAVLPAVDAGERIPQSHCVALSGGMLWAYNDELACSVPIEDEKLASVVGALDAKALAEALRSVGEVLAEVRVTEAELVLRNGRREAGVAWQRPVRLPVANLLPDETATWTAVDATWAEQLGLAATCCERQAYRTVLGCVLLRGLQAMGSDNYQIIVCKLEESVADEDVLLSGESVKHLVGAQRVLVEAGWLHAEMANGAIYSVRRYQGQYPELLQYIQGEGEPVELPAEVAGIATRASRFMEHRGDELTLQLQPGELMLEGWRQGVWYRESLPVQYQGQPLRFRITQRLLRTVIERKAPCTLLGGELPRLRARGKTFAYLTCLGKG